MKRFILLVTFAGHETPGRVGQGLDHHNSGPCPGGVLEEAEGSFRV